MTSPQISLCKLLVSVTFVALIAGLASCSDDKDITSVTHSSRFVKFNVKMGTGWDSGRATKAVGKSGTSESALTLRDGDRPLYLVPEISDGINIKKKKETSTRSSLVSRDDIQTFGVFASMNPKMGGSIDNLSPNYMWNVVVTRENDWAPTDNYLWPGTGCLHFNAYSPFIVSPSTSTGITALPASSDKGQLYLSYTTPSEVADQFDLLIAEPTDVKASPCDLVFNHALTAIRFATGNKMAPCTIKSILISGVYSKAKINMETGDWTDLSEPMTFTVAPDITLPAANGSEFVASDCFITSEEETFLLLPQQLLSDAKISVVVEEFGVETTLDTSLEGVVWEAGSTVTYRISANPHLGTFILDITDADGNPVKAITSGYTGTTLNFKVKSVYGHPDDTTRQKNMPWKAEFIDSEGNLTTKPQWISNFNMSGNGSATISTTTLMQTPVFETFSEESTALREAQDINDSSGYRPFNLSNPTGQASVQTTANCYLIHAPGFYSIPLVYGNAISGGKTNSSAYTATNSSNIHVLKQMVNHLGAPITDPYIYNNANCTPADAVLIWEGRLNLIQKVQLSPDKKRLIFVVSPDFICQGNAIVAVRDADGIVLWSWHLWVTPYKPDSDAVTINYHGKDYHLMTRNLGQVTAGDRADFKPRTAFVRFTQVPDDESEPMSVTLEVTQTGKVISTVSAYNYYQWGRKDPMISDVTEWYAVGPSANSDEVTKIWTKDFSTDRTPGIPIIADYIRTPGYFWVSPHTPEVFPYYNLWNTNFSTTNEVKTIYDPSPAGYMVSRNVLTALQNSPCVPANGDLGVGVNVTIPDTDKTIFFPTQGFRSSTDGSIQGRDSGAEIGSIWTSRTTSTTDATVLVINRAHDIIQVQGLEVRASGFGVRPAKEM